MMVSLFDFHNDAPRYPDAPGHRGVDTSIEAAEAIAPSRKTIADKVLAAIRAAGPNGLTAEECCAAVGIDRVSLQPRTSELRKALLIGDSGLRRRNASGKRAIAWVTREYLDQPEAEAA